MTRARRALRITAATALLSAVVAVDASAALPGDGPQPCGQFLGLAPFLRERPRPCWRPYADSSVWNQELNAVEPLVPHSAQLAADVGTPDHLVVGWAGTPNDYARPTYFSIPGDPVFTPHCTADFYGPCPVEGKRIAIPDDAQPAAGGDGHLTVVDTTTGWEYDFWQVTSKPVGGGDLYASWGGHARIDGDGIGADLNGAVAWGGPTYAGLIRPEELAAGAINHALFMTVPCVNETPVFPAHHNAQLCAWGHTADAPAIGQRFRLNMSDTEIAGLDVPDWKKTILRAMTHYGIIVGDTGGESGWAVQRESGAQYLSFGKPDAWVTFAQSVGLQPEDGGEYVFNLRDGIDWAHRLQVVAPCVSEGTC